MPAPGQQNYGNQQQIINGQSYTMYSPAWYAARDAEQQRQAANAGTAAGTQARSALDAFSPGALTPGSGSGSSIPPPAPLPQVPIPGGGGGVTGVAAPSLTALQASIPSPSFGSSGPVVGAGGGGGISAPTRLQAPSSVDANDALFARAKDKIGQVGRSALTTLRSHLASVGQAGGPEGKVAGSVINQGVQSLGDILREQTIQDSERARDDARLDFEGQISQRGQDITSRGQDIGAGVTTRGQDLDYSSAASRLANDLALGTYQGQITQRGQDLASQRDAYSFQQNEAQQQQQMLLSLLSRLAPQY